MIEYLNIAWGNFFRYNIDKASLLVFFKADIILADVIVKGYKSFAEKRLKIWVRLGHVDFLYQLGKGRKRLENHLPIPCKSTCH